MAAFGADIGNIQSQIGRQLGFGRNIPAVHIGYRLGPVRPVLKIGANIHRGPEVTSLERGSWKALGKGSCGRYSIVGRIRSGRGIVAIGRKNVVPGSVETRRKV